MTSTQSISDLTKHLIGEIQGLDEKRYPTRLEPWMLHNVKVLPGFSIKRNESMSQVVIGIDWGENESWAVILATSKWFMTNQIVYIERVIGPKDNHQDLYIHPHVQRIVELAKQFQPDLIIDDIGSIGKDRHRILKRMLRRKISVMAAQFDSGNANRKWAPERDTYTSIKGKVKINKTKAFRELFNDFKAKNIQLPFTNDYESCGTIDLFIGHHNNVELRNELSPKSGVVVPILRKIGRRDDHFIDAHIIARAGLCNINMNDKGLGGV